MKCPDLPEKTLLRPDEVAEFFSVDIKTVYNWNDNGILKGIKINGTLRIFRQSIINMIGNSDNTPSNKKAGRRIINKGVA